MTSAAHDEPDAVACIHDIRDCAATLRAGSTSSTSAETDLDPGLGATSDEAARAERSSQP